MLNSSSNFQFPNGVKLWNGKHGKGSPGRRLFPSGFPSLAQGAGRSWAHSLISLCPVSLWWDVGCLLTGVGQLVLWQEYFSVGNLTFYCSFWSLFWLCFLPSGELLEAIKRDFGSFQKFKEKLTAVSVGVQGSGWGWLGLNKEQGRLQVAACANQDPLQGTTGERASKLLIFPFQRDGFLERVKLQIR